jgi:hypothetical protein
MKFTGLFFGMLLATALGVRAQVSVDVSLSQDQFLAGESMPVTVTIVNRSGQTLEFGNDQEWLTFSVESKDNYAVLKNGEAPVNDMPFSVGSSQRAKPEVDIAPYFNFSRPGRYTVTATVFIKQWNQTISSSAKPFDIIIGSVMWEQEVGLPKRLGAPVEQAPEIRKYTLHQANYLRKSLMLYVQISDANGKIYKVFPIGPMLSFGQPEPQIDKHSNLHVLWQDGPRSCSYMVIDPNGTIIVRQKYDMPSKPRLKTNSEGNLEVVGGVRRVTSKDVPPPQPAETNAPPAKP